MKQPVLWLLLAVCHLLPLESGADEPIDIQADAARVDEKQGKSVYRGNVVIAQGHLEVTAEEVEIYTEAGSVVRIVARGDKASNRLAEYRQQAEVPGNEVHAEADEIIWLLREDRLNFSGNARLQQSGDMFSGDLLRYDLRQKLVDLSSRGEADRIRMTLVPEKAAPGKTDNGT